MRARDKATTLLECYMSLDIRPFSEHGLYMDKDIAKKCALIAVIEILSIVFDKKPEVYDFYYDVKTEIEKL